jgi:DNA recombination protein RmuC
MSLRSDRATIYTRGRQEAAGELATLEERLQAKDLRMQEIQDERAGERESIERLREENATLEASQSEADARLADVRRQGEEQLALINDSHQKLLETLRDSLSGKIREQDSRIEVLTHDLRGAQQEVERHLNESLSLYASVQPLREKAVELESRLVSTALELEKTRQEAESARTANASSQATAKAFIDRLHDHQRLLSSMSADLDASRKEASVLRSENTRLQAYAAEVDARIEEARRFSAGGGTTLAAGQAPAVVFSPNFDDLIQPLRESLERVGSSIAEIEQRRAGALDGLSLQVATLVDAQQQLRAETARIAGAFRTPSAQGAWSEVRLRRVIELSGLAGHCDFNPAGGGSDLTIQLPGKRHIAVDASFAVEDCFEALESADAVARAAKLREHAGNVRAHIDRLASNGHGAEFSVAFLPADSILSAALEQDSALLEYGAGRKVLLATPTTLIGLLKAVSCGWQQQDVADNARQVTELGQTVYERIRVFSGYFDKLRRSLARTVETYNLAAGSLENRVLASTRQFEALGSAHGDPIPETAGIDTIPLSLRALDAAVETATPEVFDVNGREFVSTGPNPAGVSLETL